MSAINHVLLPIDLSLNYQTLSSTTRRMFDHRSTEIVMLHTIEEPSRSVRGLDLARSMAQLEFLARQEFKFAHVSHRVERGLAADCNLHYAQTHEVDVIVMPAAGSPGYVSEAVLAEAACSVWMERMSGSVEGVRNICCAVGRDGGDVGADDALLRRASLVARELGAELTIIHAPPLQQETRIDRMRVEDLQEQFAPPASVHVEGDRLEWVVIRALYSLDAGLLVAGSRKMGPIMNVIMPRGKAFAVSA